MTSMPHTVAILYTAPTKLTRDDYVAVLYISFPFSYLTRINSGIRSNVQLLSQHYTRVRLQNIMAGNTATLPACH